MKPFALLPAALVGLTLSPAMARANEEPRYEVVALLAGLEVRRYAPVLVVETEVAGSFDEARKQAFRRLFRYISGDNRARAEIAMTVPVTTAPRGGQEIAMTAPVTTAPAERGGQVMRFVVPSKYTLETVPQPTDPALRIHELGEQVVAARRYSGRSNESNYRAEEAELLRRLAGSGWTPAGEAWFAVYDGPFTPWFMRRNEVLVPVVPAGG